MEEIEDIPTIETAEEISVIKSGVCVIKPLRVTRKGIR